MPAVQETEQLVRTRLRSLRRSAGLSLEEVAERSHLSASTISRIETGKRTIGLDVLIPLADALEISLDSLVELPGDEDVIIRGTPRRSGNRTTWVLSRPNDGTVSVRMRLLPTRRAPEPGVHPGRDWLYVLEGRVRLTLGDREVVVEVGEAAEFGTLTPHAISAVDDPAEVLLTFDRDGHRAHMHAH